MRMIYFKGLSVFTVCVLLCVMLLSVILTSCAPEHKPYDDMIVFSSFREIPGITESDIQAIEALQKEYEYFSYGMPVSTEAFEDEDGQVHGFTAFFCEWLSELIGIPFRPALYNWQDLIHDFTDGKILFTGELTATEERKQMFHMTNAVASRPVKAFRIAGARPLWEIEDTRLVRSGFIKGAATIGAVVPELTPGTFEVIEIDNFNLVYGKLRSGEIDVFYYSGVAEIFFLEYGHIVSQEFYPLIYMPVSLSTNVSALEPVIAVVDKALQNGGLHHLTKLYNNAYQEYLKFKLFKQLSDEEREYLSTNPLVRMGVDPGNYPGSFYDRRENEWRGIFLDLLDEVSSLTGITLQRVNDENTQWPEIYRMLMDGEIALVPELTQTAERADLFLWPETTQIIDYYALISNVDFHDIKVNEVLYVKVGLARGTAYTAIFRKWFPNHMNTIEYESMEEAFDALLRGEVDMVMANQKRLLYLTHYLELPNYKVNVLFDYYINAKFGFNKDEVILRSIFGKALGSIDSRNIADYWMRRTYDYRSKVAEARTPWIIGAAVLFLCVLSLIAAFYVRSRRASKELEDIVDKRTYELALQTAALTTLFDSIPDLIFTKNLDLKFLHCNKALLKHFNKDIKDIVGKNDFESLGVTHKEADGFNESDRRVIREARTIAIEEHIPRFDGSKPFYETIKMPLMLNSEVIGIMGIARDITKRKEMEHRMASSYEYAKKLNDALTTITMSPTISAGVLKDAADVIAEVGCNALNTDRVGIWIYRSETNTFDCLAYYDAYTKEHRILDSCELSSRSEYLKLLRSERLIAMNNIDECKLISVSIKDENYSFLVAALDAPIRVDGNLVGVVCVEQGPCEKYFDSRKWMIEEQNFASSLADLMALTISGYDRRKAREDAETASQTKSSFLANMSHEIRTPMNAILGVTEILIQYETLPSEIEEGLGKIYSSCDLLLGIINDILDFSKIEAGKLDIMPAQYKVASMINDSVHLNMMRINSKPIEFELQIADNVPARLIGDELRIKQILNNLLSNAFKYTESGKVTLSVASEPIPLIAYLPEHLGTGQLRWLDPEKEGTTLVLSVRDTGHGMTREQLSTMFEEYSRFYQGNNITVEGTGLGLAITQRLISLMDGEMHVESEPEVGTFFVVRLPQEKVDDEVLSKDVIDNLRQFRMSYLSHKKRGQIARDPMPYGKVLIVDDVETNLYVAVGLMKLYRLQLDTAMSGREAIEKIKEGRVYDIIFMDHMMPEMDGIETTRHLRSMGYKAPIIALTANAVAGQADVFLRSGFDEFISKPIDIRQLNSILNKMIRDKQPPEVIEAARKQKTGTTAGFTRNTQIDPILKESFIRDARKAVEWLEEQNSGAGFEDEDVMRKFTIVVHGIKSSLWNIGEAALADFAYKMEVSGRERDNKTINASVSGFVNELRQLLEKLESQKTDGSFDEDPEDIIEKLQAIQDRAADYDRKGTLDILGGIKKCSEETRKVLDNIMGYVLHSDFEKAENAADEYEQKISGKPADNTALSLLKKEIDGLDIAQGLKRYEGDGQTYLKVLRSYASSVRSLLNDINGVNKNDLNLYKIKVHGIKGTSLDIHAEEVGKEAAELEKAAKSGDLNYINQYHEAFLDKAWRLITDIDSVIASLDAENPKPKKDKPDRDVLLKLLAACKNYEMDDADNAMAEIEKYKYVSDDGLADWLRDNIDRMNFTQIAQRLSDLDMKGDE